MGTIEDSKSAQPGTEARMEVGKTRIVVVAAAGAVADEIVEARELVHGRGWCCSAASWIAVGDVLVQMRM